MDDLRITEEGIESVLEILGNSGFLPKSADTLVETQIRLVAACKEYIKASVARADARTEREERDCLLVYYLQTYLQSCLAKVN